MALKTVGVYLLEPGYCFVHVAGLVPISERVYSFFFKFINIGPGPFLFLFGAMGWIVGDS